MSLGEALTTFIADQFAVIKSRRVPTECTIKQKLPCGGDEQIRATHHLSDLHRVVVHHTSELVRWNIIMPPEDEIAEILSANISLHPARPINEGNHFAIRHTKPPIEPSSSRKLLNTFRSASPGINWLVISRVRRLQSAQNILPRTGAGINQSGQTQAFELLAINFYALALIVGSVQTPNVRSLLPIATQPFQILDKSRDKFRPRSRTIQILVPQNQSSARRTSTLLRDPKSPRVSKMKQARGRRREPSAIFSGMDIFRSDAE